MLSEMLLIRRFEERAAAAYQMQKIGGFCHLYIGQEAVVVGAVHAVRSTDPIITAYRDHGHALARGTRPEACMAELFGRATGCSRGLGGSMHFFDRTNSMWGGHAIVGGHAPLAAGIAFAGKYRGEDSVTLCFFGDGAINQGALLEALNLAALWELPVLFLCENNQYAMGTSQARSTAIEQLHHRARGFGIEAGAIDGMDVRTVRTAIAAAVDPMRRAMKPHFLEVRTYRYRGHSMSDPATYRTKEELERAKGHDPILKLRAQLTDEGKIDLARFDEIDRHAREQAAESVRHAEQAPLPPIDHLHLHLHPPGPADVASGKPS